MPGTVLVSRDIEVNKTYKILCLLEVCVLVVSGEKDNICYIKSERYSMSHSDKYYREKKADIHLGPQMLT